MTGRPRSGMEQPSPIPGKGAAAHDRPVNAPVTLKAAATPTAPALVLRPWCVEDVAALVEIYRDPELRRWASPPMECEDDGLRWVQAQERSWAAGDRFGFAVLAAALGAAPPRLVGNVVLKEFAPGKPSAEVGYWTAARARGRDVAPRALELLTAWSLDAFRADGLEGVPRTSPSGRQPGILPRCGEVRLRVRQDPAVGASLLPARWSSAHTARSCLTPPCPVLATAFPCLGKRCTPSAGAGTWHAPTRRRRPRRTPHATSPAPAPGRPRAAAAGAP